MISPKKSPNAHPFCPGHDDTDLRRYALFEIYQRHVHHEAPWQISPDGFRRFLCTSPLKHTTIQRANGELQPLGSFHQCYRLDGKLIAIGVLDLLPQCVSAVYFMYAFEIMICLGLYRLTMIDRSRYHEDVHQWHLGKIGTLREILLAIEGSFRYYYMGAYESTTFSPRSAN